ncbi:DUF748 domain-containing protein [Nitrosomonas aestuarii]|uniref:DUF748 domain-containing protein n=1 Tax=Nitrosomonas aestuarii TaxID=52441 RepID=UPI000D2FE310|nr:DUF748 domain-containing protein [Nitrosomonas aestuarii]PTN12820.1 uncharacterized protein involved in outer membrane biogenesis [Nitrosomonas aestuarii]
MTQIGSKTQSKSVRFITRKRVGISLAVIVALIALFGLLGYFWLPGYAKSQLELHLSELLERPVSVHAIEFKPYTLELSVHGFQIGERKDSADTNETFVSFDELYIDISSESITQFAPVISTITLNTLRVRLSREGEGQFNFSDLIEKFSRPTEDDEDQPALFSVSNIILKNGHIEWVDHFKKNHQNISEINFAIPFVANLDKMKANWIEPHFNAKINGAPISLEGKLRPFTDKREATLSLNLDNINLMSLDEYVPFPTGIRLISGYFKSNLTLAFTQFNEETPAITLSGETELKQVTVKNESVQTPYQFDLGNLHLRLNQYDLTGQKPSRLGLYLGDIALSPLSSPLTDKKEAALSLQKVTVNDLLLDMSARNVALNTITLDGLTGVVNREIDGTINLAKFFTASDADEFFTPTNDAPDVHTALIPKPNRKPSHQEFEARLNLAANQETSPETPETGASAIPVPGRKPLYKEGIAVQIENEQDESQNASWLVQIKQLKLNAAAIQYADLSLSDVAPMVIDPLDLSVENIDISGTKPLDLKLNARVNQHGSIEADGLLAWSPFAVNLNLNLNAVDLVSLQGWAGDTLNVLLTSGDLSFQGAVKADGEPLLVAVSGDGQLGNFNIFDPETARDLLRWKNLDINGLDFANEPLKVNIDTVKLGNFFARVMLLPNGELNLKQILRQDETAALEDNQAQTDVAATGKTQEKETMPLHIGKVMLQQGNVDFQDRFVQPNYHANLTGLAGQIGPIHSTQTGTIDIKGAIDRTAPLEIRGKIEPFGSELLLDIIAKAKEIDLPQFSPYSGKYVGYAIEKGKLSVDIHYHIEQGVLTAENNVFLDQFTLGDRVESEEAVSVPLKLAIALLKNRRGEIDIHLPIKGSIDDPQFSMGDIILDAFINLITRAVTAPFALLGSMFGEGEELSEIIFSPGLASIETEAESRLQALSEILKDRPALRLEIAGHVDPVNDHEGLKHAILQRKVKAQKLTAETQKGHTAGSLENVKLTPDEYSNFLEIVYKETDFEKPTNFFGFTKSLPDEDMERLLLEHIEVSEDDMQELAHDRAVAAQSWLLNKGEISGDRLFVLGMQKTKESEGNAGNRVEFILK